MENKLQRIQKIIEKGFGIENMFKQTRENDYFLARSCFHKHVIDKYKYSYPTLAKITGESKETIGFSYRNFDRYCEQFSYLKDRYMDIEKEIDRKSGVLKNQEIEYLLKLLERERGWRTKDPLIVHATLSKTDIYFLQNKLESLKV